MSQEGNNMYYCSFVSIHYIICECGETFPTENSLKIHLEKEHPFKKERKEFRCGVCSAIYNTEEECVEHYRSNHLGIKQEHDYAEQDEEYEETEVEEAGYNAPGSVQYIYEDIETYNPEEVEFNQICELCGEVYYVSNGHTCPVGNEEGKLSRRKVIHPTTVVKKKIQKKKVICEFCGGKYASGAALRYHQRSHTGERPFKCSFCPKAFTMPLFLQIHHRTHTGERPFICPYKDCTKAFSNKPALMRHDRVHTGVKPYGCPKCDKFFTQSNSMKLHVKTVHLKMPAPYKSKNRKAKKEKIAEKKMEERKKEEEILSNLAEAKMEFASKEETEQYIVYEDDLDSDVSYEIVYAD